RNAFLQMTKNTFTSEQSSVINALCFGTSGEVAPSLRRELQNSGAVHLLTVSGLQVFLLAWLLQWVLSVAPIPRTIQIGIIFLILALYTCAAGLHPSVLRAGIMAIVTLVAYLFRREPDFLSALGLAAIITLLWQPWAVFTP